MTSAPLRTLQLGFILAGRGPMTGSQRYYVDLLRALPGAGVTADGLVVGDPATIDPPLPGLERFAAEEGGSVARLRGLRAAVRERRGAADVVVSHAPAHTWPIRDLVRQKPLVVHFHGPLLREGIAEGRRLPNLVRRAFAESAGYRGAQRFIALSQAFAAFLRRDHGIPDERIRVIPGGVDLAAFGASLTRAEARERLGWPLDRPIVVAVRRLAETKGLDLLIDAVARIRAHVPDLLVVLVGRGPLREALEARVASHALESTVRFTGGVDEATLRLAYRAADLTVVPTVSLEGFGLSVVESLASGTPALVTPVAGLPEVVTELDPASVAEAASVPALADAVRGALDGSRPLPGEERCLRYAARFGWPTIAARIADVYRESLD